MVIGDPEVRGGTQAFLMTLAVLVVAWPSAAVAATTSTRTVTSVSGVQIAQQLAGQLRGVQLGSTGATVTLDVAGRPSPIRVDFPGAGGSADGQPSGLLTLAAIPVAGAALVRFLNFLTKLGSR
jgi:hypothetical protein